MEQTEEIQAGHGQSLHSGGHSEGHAHPAPIEYVKIAVVLAIVTIAEVAVYYVDTLRPLLTPILIVMSGIKFFFVAMWFMHLKFDSLLFRRLFLVGIVLAALVYGAVLVMFGLLEG